MKANLVNIIFGKICLGIVISSMMSTLAYGQSSSDGDETVESLSKLGIETGLELYNRDKSDYCVMDGLQVRATVNGVTADGIMKLELFGEEDFLKKKGKLRNIRVPAEEGSQLICINVPMPGSYAVVGYHDRDGNRKLKKAWNFKPLEPYGLSNNPEIKALRLPKYSETKFDVPLTGADITINLVDLTSKD